MSSLLNCFRFDTRRRISRSSASHPYAEKALEDSSTGTCTPTSDESREDVQQADHTDAAAFWTHTLNSSLSVLMSEAGYDRDTQDHALRFCSANVTPYLGPSPQGSHGRPWRSFMTDDFSPVEYSWSWEPEPKIRFAFEPIGAEAGTATDPFNRKRPLECADALRSALPHSNWEWFDAFAETFYDAHKGVGPAPLTANDHSSPSSIFLALEIGKGQPMCKAYLIPVRAEQTGCSRLAVLTEGVRCVETKSVTLPAYTALESYIQRQEPTAPFDIIGVAVDCVAPSLSKLKIYLRAPRTSFDAVCSTLTLGGANPLWTEAALAELRELWYLVLSLDGGYPTALELPYAQHETSGVLYNFDIQSNNAVADTKVYIPVKRYGTSDRTITAGLTSFLERRGRSAQARSFARAVERMADYRSLDDRGLQTYVSCAIKRGTLQLTSYVSSEVHHPGRSRAIESINY